MQQPMQQQPMQQQPMQQQQQPMQQQPMQQLTGATGAAPSGSAAPSGRPGPQEMLAQLAKEMNEMNHMILTLIQKNKEKTRKGYLV